MFGKQKVSLVRGNTPLEHLKNLSADLGINLYIKRDDLLADIGMGGNKLRKLEYLVAEAEEQGATTLLTFGGAQTNHGRLTAAAAAKRGLKCIIVAVDEHPELLSANVLLDRLMGCEVYIVQPDGTDDQQERFAEKITKEREAKGERVYQIPVGGSNVLGSLGYMDCAHELYGQMKEQGIADATVVCGAGSLGTYLGLWTGMKLEKATGDIIGIAISPFGEAKEARIMEYFGQIKQEYGLDITANRSDFHIETGYVGGGYNVPDANTRAAIYQMAGREAIILDPCYTGKAFAGLLSMIKEGKIKKGETVVFLHTGGSPAIYTPFHRVEMEKELQGGYHLV